MADNREIYRFELDTAQAEKALKDLTLQLQLDREELKKLNTLYKDGKVGTADFAQEQNRLKEKIKENNAEIRRHNTILKQTDNSLDGQRKRLAALNAEYRKLDPTVKKDAERMKQLGREIGNLNNDIKKHEAQLGQFQRNVGNYSGGITDAFGKIGKSILSLAGPMIAAFGVQQIKQFATESVNAYGIQAEAEATLLTALKGRADIQQRMIKQAQELQKTSIIGDEEIIRQQAFLVALGRTEEEINAITQAAADLSAAKPGMSFESAVNNLSKTYSGLAGELGESVDGLRDLTAEELKAGKAVELVQAQFQGFAQTVAETGTGPIKQMQNAWSDFQEELGGAIVDTGALTMTKDFVEEDLIPVMRGLLTIVTDIGKAFSEQNSKQLPGWLRWLNEIRKELNKKIFWGAIIQAGEKGQPETDPMAARFPERSGGGFWLGKDRADVNKKREADDKKRREEERKEWEKFIADQKKAAQEIEKLRADLIADRYMREAELLRLQAEQQIKAAVGTAEQIAEQRMLIEERLQRALRDLRLKEADEIITQFDAAAQKIIATISASIRVGPEGELTPDEFPILKVPDELQNRLNQVNEQLLNIFSAESLTQKLEALQTVSAEAFGVLDGLWANSKEEQLRAAENNAEEMERINKKFAKKEQAVAVIMSLINTAVAITKALPNPLGVAFAALTGAAQTAVIASQSFASGGFTGDGSFSDPFLPGRNVAGYVHDNEYVVPTKVMNTPKGAGMVGALEAIRTGKIPGYADGGFAARNAIRGAGISGTEIAREVLRNMPPLVVTVGDIRRANAKYAAVVGGANY